MIRKRILLLTVGLLLGLPLGIIGSRWYSASSAREKQIQISLTGSQEAQTAVDRTKASEPDWCVEHRVPESECTKCNPELIDSFKKKGDWCDEHQIPESHDRICNPGLMFGQELQFEITGELPYKPSVFFPKNKSKCATDDAIIQFATTETAERAGISVVPAIEITESASIDAPSEIVFDETKSFAIATIIPSSVVWWLVEPSQQVMAGQPLAELESPDMPRLQAEYLEAAAEVLLKEQEYGRADSLRRKGLIATAEYQQFDGSLKTAQAHLFGLAGMLKSAGFNNDGIRSLVTSNTISPRWLLSAPASGSLLERKAPLGEFLQAGSTIALIGDPSALWIEAHVREADLHLFHRGQIVEFAADGEALDRVNARVIWVAQFIEPQTRTATVRAEVTGETANLQAHRFGRLLLSSPAQTPTVAVPRDAVQWEGCCNVVFVQETVGRYRPHKVTLMRGERGYYDVSSGLRPGDMVVTGGSYLLKTELKKGSLGAGCCDIAAK